MSVTNIIIVALAVFLLLTLCLVFLPPYIIFRKILIRKKVGKNNRVRAGAWGEINKRIDEFSENIKNLPHKKVQLITKKYGKSSGLYFGASVGNGCGSDKTVILVHGHHADMSSRFPNVMAYLKHGFNVLLFDNVAHGESDGKYITMGQSDAEVVMEWVTYLTEHGQKSVVLDGVSMGGAIVLSVGNLPNNSAIKAIVSDCAFTSVKDVFCSQLRSRFMCFIGRLYLINMIGFYCKHLAHFEFDKMTPLCGVKQSVTPTLFLHGEKDRYVPYEMLDILYSQNASSKEKVTIKNAAHATSYVVDGELYEKSIFNFLAKYVKD